MESNERERLKREETAGSRGWPGFGKWDQSSPMFLFSFHFLGRDGPGLLAFPRILQSFLSGSSGSRGGRRPRVSAELPRFLSEIDFGVTSGKSKVCAIKCSMRWFRSEKLWSGPERVELKVVHWSTSCYRSHISQLCLSGWPWPLPGRGLITPSLWWRCFSQTLTCSIPGHITQINAYLRASLCTDSACISMQTSYSDWTWSQNLQSVSFL